MVLDSISGTHRGGNVAAVTEYAFQVTYRGYVLIFLALVGAHEKGTAEPESKT